MVPNLAMRRLLANMSIQPFGFSYPFHGSYFSPSLPHVTQTFGGYTLPHLSIQTIMSFVFPVFIVTVSATDSVLRGIKNVFNVDASFLYVFSQFFLLCGYWIQLMPHWELHSSEETESPQYGRLANFLIRWKVVENLYRSFVQYPICYIWPTAFFILSIAGSDSSLWYRSTSIFKETLFWVYFAIYCVAMLTVTCVSDRYNQMLIKFEKGN